MGVLQIGMELDRWLANHRPHLTCTAAVQRHSGALYQVQEHCIRYSAQEMGEYKSGSPTSTSGGRIRSVGKPDLGYMVGVAKYQHGGSLAKKSCMRDWDT